MIRTQIRTHSRLEIVAMYGTPYTIPPHNINSILVARIKPVIISSRIGKSLSPGTSLKVHHISH
jgi:hypothetical protein